MTYITIIIIGIILSLSFDGKEKNNKNTYVNLYIIIFVVISAISDNLGADAYTYRARFDLYIGDFSKENIVSWVLLYGYMPLWTIINETAVALGCTYSFVQTIIAISINSVVGYFVKNNTNYPFITLVIYFLVSYFYMNFEVQREALAIAIGFVGLINYLNGHRIIYWICIFIATLFHISAICLFVFPIIPKFKLSWLRLFLAFCISLFIYIISDYFVKLIPSFGAGSLSDKVEGYASATVTIFGFLLHTIRRLFVPFVSYLIMRKIYPQKYEYIDRFIPFYLCFSILSCAIPGTFRLINYMMPVSILIMSDLIVALAHRTIKGVKVLLAIFVFLLYTNHNISHMFTYYPMSGYHRYDLYIPYSTIFDDYEDYSYRDWIHKEALDGKTQDNERKK